MYRVSKYEWSRRRDVVRFVIRSRQNIPTGDGDKGKKKTAKNEIRRQFHVQLENLWKRTPYLAAKLKTLPMGTVQTRRIHIEGGHDLYGGQLEGIDFIPLVTYGSPWACEHLDIRFLIRQDCLDAIDPKVGDLDGRLPVLFDALRIPHVKGQLIDEREEIPNPCFCLLEDDSLIQRVSVETLHLLNDQRENEQTPEQDHVVHVLVSLKRREKEFNLFGA
jgi:hypothetical protein